MATLNSNYLQQFNLLDIPGSTINAVALKYSPKYNPNSSEYTTDVTHFQAHLLSVQLLREEYIPLHHILIGYAKSASSELDKQIRP